MMADLRIDKTYLESICCPVCGTALGEPPDDFFLCANSACATRFPIVDGIPILINEANSLFSIQDFEQHQDTFLSTQDSVLRTLRKALLPSISANIDSDLHYHSFTELVFQKRERPNVLVIGGGIVGQGMEGVYRSPIHFMETDISLGPRTNMICDAHDLPFLDGTFDGVIAQAVLEHVVDPYRCAEEIYRVLSPQGIVYAETPFMQQVHGGRYDFTRFTHIGHRRLFRRFDEIDSGVICGPGMALAWSYRYFLLSFVHSRIAIRLVDAFAHFTSFWLKYFDRYLAKKPGALDAASGYYFLGRKNDHILTDQDILAFYRGQM